MSDTSIHAEVRKFIADKIAKGESVIVDWLTHEIVGSKPGIEGPDAEFYRVCAYATVRDAVKRCVGKYAPRPETDRQLTLAGFSHLQIAYTVTRGGQVTLVPVSNLSDEELLARAGEYDTMADGCKAHAVEIRSYIRARRLAA